jgi:VWFA-related protein
MSRAFRILHCITLLTWLPLLALGQNQPVSPAGQTPVKINTSEVLLDVLVKDKKDRPVRDLKPEEIEVYEDGEKQSLNSLRLITFDAEKKSSNKNGEPKPTAPTSLQQVNLVTLVFDHFDAIRNQAARNAAFNYIDNTLNDRMLVRVLVAGPKLYVIEQFTNNLKKLRQAITKATVPTEKTFSEASERITAQLKTLTEAATPETAENSELTLARLTLNTLAEAEKARQENKINAPIFSLLHVARAQRHLPGRKIVVYFANGSYIPVGLQDALHNAISEANRANVSFYAVDVTGVIAGAGAQSSRLENGEVRNDTRRAPPAYFNARRSTFSMFEGIERKMVQGQVSNLHSLCDGTGGFVIDDSSDFNGALRRVTSELSSYYALAYNPSRQEHDGKFRTITVKVLRPGVKTQTRSGYFALPPTSSGNPVLSYETPLLAALHNAVVPRDFSFHSTVLHHAVREQEQLYTFALEVPLANFIHAENQRAQKQAINFSLLGLIKNEQGEIVQRFSETHPAEIPLDRLEAVRKEQFLVQRHFWLPPGSYTFEIACHDALTDKLGARRIPFTVATPQPGLQTSSLFLVKQVEPIEDAAAEADNPLLTENKLLIPRLDERLSLAAERELSFHLAVFLAEKTTAAPTVKIELLREGKVIASSQPDLPKPDKSGRISFAAGLPLAGLEPGNYQLRAMVNQDSQTTEETTSFILIGDGNQPIVAAGADNESVITSDLSLTDATGELTLSALKEAKPIDLSINTLLQETEQNGARMFKQLGAYTYSLRKVRRVLDPKGRIREEEYKDYEAYPVKGRHALVQLSANGERLKGERIELDRKQATEVLVKDEEAKSKANEDAAQRVTANYWVASLSGFTKRNKYVYVTIDPALFFTACEFSAPRTGLLEGRETIILRFRPRAEAKLESDQAWVGKLEGNLWIDVADRSLVRIEGQEAAPAAGTQPVLNFVYQQQRLAEGMWSPRLIRLNAGGNEALFGGLNWDAWFEFNNYKRFDSQGSDLKVLAPGEKKPDF